MEIKQKYVLVGLSLCFVLLLGSYVAFTSYKPKIIKQIEDVKGYHTENPSDFALPEGAEKIGINRSAESTQLTFHTNKTQNEVQDFYKNIFTSNKWVMESQGAHDDFVVSRYKKDNQQISVITMIGNDDYKTLVSIETTKL